MGHKHVESTNPVLDCGVPLHGKNWSRPYVIIGLGNADSCIPLQVSSTKAFTILCGNN